MILVLLQYVSFKLVVCRCDLTIGVVIWTLKMQSFFKVWSMSQSGLSTNNSQSAGLSSNVWMLMNNSLTWQLLFIDNMIEIFLIFDEIPIPILSISLSDVKRLAVSPFRWICYVMFVICGSQGDLSATPNGPSVNYNETELADADSKYYYQPEGELSFCVWDAAHNVLTSLGDHAFVDHEGLNNWLTSTEQTSCCAHFRSSVIDQDGHACIVLQAQEVDCDAAHLITRSKGYEVIFVISPHNYLMTLFSSILQMWYDFILLEMTQHPPWMSGLMTQ